MALEQRRVPYEFLARLNHEGVLVGAQVQYSNVIVNDGVLVSSIPEDPVSVDVGTGVGFPLAEALKPLNVGALTRCEQLTQTLAERQAELTQKAGRLVEVETALDEMAARLVTLTEAVKAAGGQIEVTSS